MLGGIRTSTNFNPSLLRPSCTLNFPASLAISCTSMLCSFSSWAYLSESTSPWKSSGNGDDFHRKPFISGLCCNGRNEEYPRH